MNSKYQYSDDYFYKLESRWNKISYEIISQLYLDVFKGYSFQSSLDIGCGRGTYLNLLKTNCEEVSGIDISNEAVRFCRTLDYKKIKQSSAEKILFPDNQFDLVFSSEVLEHIKRYRSALKEKYRILKKGGYLFLTTTSYSPSIFIFIKYIITNKDYRLLLKEIIRYFFGYCSYKSQRRFIQSWCYDKLGGHYHGFILRKLKKELKSIGFKIVRSGKLYIINPIHLGFHNWVGKALDLSNNWSVIKRVIAIPLAFVLYIVNFILKSMKLYSNNIYIVVVKI